jgi:hypothetical protein
MLRKIRMQNVNPRPMRAVALTRSVARITAGFTLVAVSSTMTGCATSGEEFRARSQAVEEEGEPCLVGEHVIEHSCVHVTFGPFASVAAAPYPGPVFSAISTPHTAYTVTLPSSGSEYSGQVIYQPSTTGAFAFFLAPDVELTLYPSSGLALAPVGEQPIAPAECAGLASAVVYQLDETETYTVVAGPSAASSYLAIVEYLGSEPSCEECEHVDLAASLSRHPYQREDASVHLEHEVTFEIPEEIAVTEGDSVGAKATLKFGHEGEWSRCKYKGHVSHPETLTLDNCNHGFVAGDDAEADSFELKLTSVGPCGVVGVDLEIQPEVCEEHDHE